MKPQRVSYLSPFTNADKLILIQICFIGDIHFLNLLFPF